MRHEGFPLVAVELFSHIQQSTKKQALVEFSEPREDNKAAVLNLSARVLLSLLGLECCSFSRCQLGGLRFELL